MRLDVWGICGKNFISYGAHLIFYIIKLNYVQWYSTVFGSVFIYGKFPVWGFWMGFITFEPFMGQEHVVKSL